MVRRRRLVLCLLVKREALLERTYVRPTRTRTDEATKNRAFLLLVQQGFFLRERRPLVRCSQLEAARIEIEGSKDTPKHSLQNSAGLSSSPPPPAIIFAFFVKKIST